MSASEETLRVECGLKRDTPTPRCQEADKNTEREIGHLPTITAVNSFFATPRAQTLRPLHFEQRGRGCGIPTSDVTQRASGLRSHSRTTEQRVRRRAAAEIAAPALRPTHPNYLGVEPLLAASQETCETKTHEQQADALKSAICSVGTRKRWCFPRNRQQRDFVSENVHLLDQRCGRRR